MSALKKNVLVVDDDPVVGRSFERVLSGKGYAVITARDGPEALRKLAEVDFDVVFTDIRMPGMDGLEVASRVKARRPWVPVVIVTGHGTEASEARARQVGVSDILHKPLSPEMIEGSAREALLGARNAAPAPETAEVATLPALEDASRGKRSRGKQIALFLASPFIGLAYVVAFPFVGVGLLAWYGGRALFKRFNTR